VGYAWFDPETDDGSGYNYSEDLIPQLPKIYETITCSVSNKFQGGRYKFLVHSQNRFQQRLKGFNLEITKL
jgi:hypothetical protein